MYWNNSTAAKEFLLAKHSFPDDMQKSVLQISFHLVIDIKPDQVVPVLGRLNVIPFITKDIQG